MLFLFLKLFTYSSLRNRKGELRLKAKTLKELLTIEQIMDLMEHLGADYIQGRRSNEIHYRTICHCGNSHKLYFYLDSKEFHCYSECGQLDIISIVQNVLNKNFLQAKDYIAKRYGLYSSESMEIGSFGGEENFGEDIEILNRTYEPKVVDMTRTFNEINENVFRRFHNMYHPAFYEDGISIKTMRKYEIMYDILKRRIIIPHREENGVLVAIRSRNLDEDLVEGKMKYTPITINGVLLSAKTQLYLYGLYYNIENIKRMKKIILVESEKAVMQLDTILGEENNISVALSSSNLSMVQVELIKSLGVEEVIIAVDKDYHEYGTKEEQINAIKVRKAIIDKLLGYFSISVLWDKENLLGYKDSPTDHGKEVFFHLYKNRIKV